MIEPHQPPTAPGDILARAQPTSDFPCAMRLHREDPCKGWLLEIHSAWILDDDHPLLDDDAACINAFDCVQRFVEIGRNTLGRPDLPAGADLRIRLMGNSGEWAMYEFTSLTGADLDAAISRFSVAYGREPLR